MIEIEKKDWEKMKAFAESALKEIAIQYEMHNVTLKLAKEKLKYWEAEKTTTETARQKNTE